MALIFRMLSAMLDMNVPDIMIFIMIPTGFPSQRACNEDLDVSFEVSLNKPWKQWRCRRFEASR